LAYFNIPISTVLRGLAMGVGLVYIWLLSDRRGKKAALIYLVTLGLFMMVHLVTNYIAKEPFNMSLELTYMIKTVFFIKLLLVYVFVIKSFSEKKNWQQLIQLSVLINVIFIAIVMLLANLTGSGHKSYNALAKEGHSGWFFSANELSIILGMGLSIMILYMVQKSKLWDKALLVPAIGLVIWAMLTVGTKVSFGSIIIVLAISIVLFIIKAIYHKRHWLNAIILSVFLAATILMTPSSPVGNNVGLTFGTDIINQGNRPADVENDETDKQQVDQRLLSGRKDFLHNIKAQYEEAPISQKLFGMGIGGNYTTTPKLIEMDFLDWYFNFGISGFVLLLVPLIYIGYRILVNLFNFHLKKINTPIVLVGVSVCLGFGSAFTAGHVLSSPAVSIYLAVLIGYLFTLTNQKPST